MTKQKCTCAFKDRGCHATRVLLCIVDAWVWRRSITNLFDRITTGVIYVFSSWKFSKSLLYYIDSVSKFGGFFQKDVQKHMQTNGGGHIQQIVRVISTTLQQRHQKCSRCMWIFLVLVRYFISFFLKLKVAQLFIPVLYRYICIDTLLQCNGALFRFLSLMIGFFSLKKFDKSKAMTNKRASNNRANCRLAAISCAHEIVSTATNDGAWSNAMISIRLQVSLFVCSLIVFWSMLADECELFSKFIRRLVAVFRHGSLIRLLRLQLDVISTKVIDYYFKVNSHILFVISSAKIGNERDVDWIHDTANIESIFFNNKSILIFLIITK